MIVIFLAMNRKPGNEIGGIIAFLAILVMAYCVSQMWIRYIKEYVDFTIEQKFKKDDKEIENQ